MLARFLFIPYFTTNKSKCVAPHLQYASGYQIGLFFLNGKLVQFYRLLLSSFLANAFSFFTFYFFFPYTCPLDHSISTLRTYTSPTASTFASFLLLSMRLIVTALFSAPALLPAHLILT